MASQYAEAFKDLRGWVMNTQDIVAERTLLGVSPDGQRREVKLLVMKPKAQPDDGAWEVTVNLRGFEERTHGVVGMDSWQALSLAMDFAKSRVTYFIEKGWLFYWGDEESEEESFSVDDL
jgi:hypothetical protein